MSLLAILVTLPIGDWLSKLPKEKQQVPKAFVESTRLPGKPPASAKDVLGAWQMDYSVDDVRVEDNDFNVDLVVNIILQLNEDGTYQLRYKGQWGRKKDVRGVMVNEAGTYKLSRDVLILDPAETERTELVKNKPAGSNGMANEKHVFVIQAETKRIHIAGKCAAYQVDPLCKDWQVENVWFTLQDGAKKLKR